jgi:hypothetical protein
MTLDWLLGWWNLIFVAPFFIALLYLGVYTLTGIGGGDGDAHGADHDAGDGGHGDTDADADSDAHMEAGADADADSDTDTDSDTSNGGHSHHEGSRGATSAGPVSLALSWIGVGRIPFTLLIIVMMLTWGSAGFMTNSVVRPHTDWEAARWSIPIALLVSLLATKLVTGFIGRFVPLNETYARRWRELVGRSGEALYDINGDFGMAAVRDSGGDLMQVPCRVGEGVEKIDKGRRIKLIAYSERDKMYFVADSDGPRRSD